jgi:hypothetical protein
MIANKTYWLVFESNANPPEFDEKTLGLINVNDNSVEGLYNNENNTYSNCIFNTIFSLTKDGIIN